MPPKRFHEQYDNDTGEGNLNIKKIRIVRGGNSENDSDEGIKKIRIVRGGSWREDIIIGEIGVWLENIRVRDQKQALICVTYEACSLWLIPEMRMENQDIGKFNTRKIKSE